MIIVIFSTTFEWFEASEVLTDTLGNLKKLIDDAWNSTGQRGLFQMDAGGYATPATYSVEGKQYVVIAAGGGGKPGTRPGDAYYCFTLP